MPRKKKGLLASILHPKRTKPRWTGEQKRAAKQGKAQSFLNTHVFEWQPLPHKGVPAFRKTKSGVRTKHPSMRRQGINKRVPK